MNERGGGLGDCMKQHSACEIRVSGWDAFRGEGMRCGQGVARRGKRQGEVEGGGKGCWDRQTGWHAVSECGNVGYTGWGAADERGKVVLIAKCMVCRNQMVWMGRVHLLGKGGQRES